jgi:hypothetical protein
MMFPAVPQWIAPMWTTLNLVGSAADRTLNINVKARGHHHGAMPGRVTACTLALSPIRDTHSEGFSYFVTSIAAPAASGWSGCRVGLTPTGKRRLVTAHTRSRHLPKVTVARSLFEGADCERTVAPVCGTRAGG